MTGELTPTSWTESYTVRIRYKVGDAPQVMVVKPELGPRDDGTEIPHVYQDPLRLCLYLPNRGEWGPADKLTETIVPWAKEWLVYYEAWRVTGEWHGGGEHPDGRGKNRQRRRRTR